MNTLVPIRKHSQNTTNEAKHVPTLSSWIDDLFNRDFGSNFTANFNTGITLPSVNIKENSDAFIIEMAVPGMKKESFSIHVDNELLSISAEEKSNEKRDDENYSRREFGYSSFKRSFTLPETADVEKISASYIDGLLQVSIAKREEAKRKPARQIEIS